MPVKLLKSKKLLLVISVVFGVVCTLLGGGKLVAYLIVLAVGLFLGARYVSFKQMYKDYRLALRVNSIQFSANETIRVQTENKQLKEELSSVLQRLELHQMMNNQTAAQPFKGGLPNNDDQHSNGVAGIR